MRQIVFSTRKLAANLVTRDLLAFADPGIVMDLDPGADPTPEPAPSPLVVTGYSQSSHFPEIWTRAASAAIMQDGLATPFAATGNAGGEFIRMHLDRLGRVGQITLGATTTQGGWGAEYLNGRLLQVSPDSGQTWSTVRALSGFADEQIRSLPVDLDCTDIRVYAPTATWIAIGEFRLVI